MKRTILPRNRKWWLFAGLLVLQTAFFFAACGDSPTESRQLQKEEQKDKDEKE
jgi:hypothetical protein